MWAKVKQRIWEWRGVWIAAPCLTILLLGLRWTGGLQMLEWALLDRYFRLRPPESPDDRIVLVTIDESDLRDVGQWPVPDRVLAELLNKIKAQKPRAIGLDIYRDLPVEPGHQELVEIYKSTPNLIGIKKVVGDENAFGVNPPRELAELDQVSANDFVKDADGKIRRGFFYLSDREGNPVYSLGFTVAWLYLEAVGIPVGLTDENWIKFGDVVFPPFEPNDGGYIRAEASGYQILLNFRGPSCLQDRNHCPYQLVSMTDVLKNQVADDLMRDRIVLIGSTAESLNDFFFTPYSSGLITTPEPTAGVEIHANVASQILDKVLGDRPLVKTWSEPLEWAWIFAWSALGSTIAWKWRYSSGTTHISWLSSGGLFLSICTLFGITYFVFLEGWWIPVVPPLLGLLGSAIAIQGYIARTAGEIRKTFGIYLNDGVIANLLESPQGFKLGGENRNVTLLLSDLRGFTALAKPLPPEKVVKLLNIYLERMCQIIEEYNGTIDKFMGDAILVIFGAPTSREDDPERAVACAIAMQIAMKEINQQLRQLNLPFIEMGIGIHTGEVIVGNIGSQKHAEYTAIGSEVNLVSRIESYTIGGQILISEATMQSIKSPLRIDDKKIINPKGFNEEITIYEVGGIGGQYMQFMPKIEAELFPVKPEIAFTYSLIDGKHINSTQYRATLVKLSEELAEIKTERLIETLSNIKINLDIELNSEEEPGDIYAKVLKKCSVDEPFFLIRFTSMPSEIAVQLCKFYQ